MTLQDHLDALLRRLRRQRWLSGLAVVVPVAAALSIGLGWWLVRSGFDANVVWTARLVGAVVVAAAGAWLIWWPLRRLQKDPVQAVENAMPVFAGRIETWATAADDNPLKPLLGADAQRIARAHPPTLIIPARQLAGPALAASLGAVALLLVATLGPGFLGHGVRHLWAGWVVPGLKPEQQITVYPGNELVRRGGRLAVIAEVAGFAPAQVTVHARTGGGEWRSAPMSPRDEQFGFTFVGIREPVEYFVSAAGIRSARFAIQVVDLPPVISSSMTLHFPPWTGRDPEQREGVGDIKAVAGTRVVVELETESSIPAGQLVVDGAGSALDINDRTVRGELQISGDGQFFVAALVGGEQVRLTPDYFLTELADAAPVASFQTPGRDVGATSIEEVQLSLRARDDFALEALELHFSVNGAQWQSVPFEISSRTADVDYMLMLEDLGGADFLRPGDLISYYAQAKDRASEQQSDMYFIDIQPFDRRVTQSQINGGQNAGQGQENEISQRQKEIILSTWNLKRDVEQGDKDVARIDNNINLVADLQVTLAEQATTLADRARARRLGSDAAIATFIEHLDKAVEAMAPAVRHLRARNLTEALAPEQQALQHLKRAEAAFTDIEVSMAQNRNSGGQRGRDLAEMLELEMDLEKNQYETGSQARPQAPEAAADETLRELEELARRQERLAQQASTGQTAPAQRWQQEALKREAQRLRDQLERMTAGSEGRAASNAGEGTPPPQRSELQRRMESAIRAMDDAAQAMADGGDPQALKQAASEAQAQLEGARQAAKLDRQQSLATAFSDVARRARDIAQRQARLERDLEQAVDEANSLVNNDTADLTLQAEQALSTGKRILLKELQELDQAMRLTAQDYQSSAPRASDTLRQAADDLERSEAAQRLGVAAEYIEYGAAAYIVSSEGMVTDALQELAAATRQASELATQSDLRSSDKLAQAMSEVRELRRSLDQLAQDASAGGGGPGLAGDDGELATQGGAGGDRAPSGATFDTRERLRDALSDPALRQVVRRDVADATAQVRRVLPDLRNRGIDAAELEQVRELLNQVDLNQFSGNVNLLDSEFAALHTLVQKLELAMARSDLDRAAVQSVAPLPLPAAYRQAIADYYSRLSEEGHAAATHDSEK